MSDYVCQFCFNEGAEKIKYNKMTLIICVQCKTLINDPNVNIYVSERKSPNLETENSKLKCE